MKIRINEDSIYKGNVEIAEKEVKLVNILINGDSIYKGIISASKGKLLIKNRQ